MSIFTADEIEVWTECTPEDDEHEQPWRWSIRIDGVEHGGGWVTVRSHAFVQAANYIRDLEMGNFDARTPSGPLLDNVDSEDTP